MLSGCRLKAAFDKGEGASMGLWQCLPGANVSRTLARTPGIDWVMVDCEHGNLDGRKALVAMFYGKESRTDKRVFGQPRCRDA